MSFKVHPQQLAKPDANSNDNQQHPSIQVHHDQCRICLQDTPPLIVPCKCDGTVKYIHQQCLRQWAVQVIKKKMKQQHQQGQNDQIHSIQCQLCKENISLIMQWKRNWLSLQEAQQKCQEFFWALLVVNSLIFLICLVGLVFIVVTSILALAKSNAVNYQKYQNQPLYMWGITIAVLVFGTIFIIKSLKDVLNMFIQREFKIKGISGVQQNKQNRRNFISKAPIQQYLNDLNLKTSQMHSPQSQPIMNRNQKLISTGKKYQEQSSDQQLIFFSRQTDKSYKVQAHQNLNTLVN